MTHQTEYSDFVIVGAGIAGIAAAYRMQQRNPGLSYTLLERRQRIGGTWDLFRYPGVRSDGDIFTLSYPFEPWTRPESIADGEHIRHYLAETARKNGIDTHIRFKTHVLSADWDSKSDTWTVRTEQDGPEGPIKTTYRGRFLFFGTGYYDYDTPYTPEFAGIHDFNGEVVHPQHWPATMNYSGKHVVVIGSGATAISMIPALASKAARVTMLQRSPTYLSSVSRINPALNTLRQLLPTRISHTVARFYFTLVTMAGYALARKAPSKFKKLIRAAAEQQLPQGYDVDTHFTPRYEPWDQRLCATLDGDFYSEIARGRVEVVTDHIDHMDSTGVVLTSGERIDADVIVTATGLQLQPLGGVSLSIDGVEFDPTERFVYKEHLIEGVPNAAWCVGYTNASWTLRADLTAQAVAKLMAYMGKRGYTHAYPHLGDTPIQEKPTFDLTSGYLQRAPRAMLRSGTRRPWKVRHNYLLDLLDRRFDRIKESMVFGHAVADARSSSAEHR